MKWGRKHKLLAVIGICLLVAIIPNIGLLGKPTQAEAITAETAETDTAKEEKEPAAVAESAGSPISLAKINANKLIAENNKFELFMDQANGQIVVRNKATGQEWLGAPAAPEKTPPNSMKVISNPININYTKGKEVVATTPEKEKATAVFEPIEQGVRMSYDIASLGLKLAVEYRLTDEGFDLKIPFSSIEERSDVKLTSIELLPFFDAALTTDEGALFIPDGSGSLLRFKMEKPTNFDFYSEFIYGGDHAFQTKVYEKVGALRFETVSKTPREKIALPVFGSYKKNHAFLGIVTEGASDAKINAYPAGIRNIGLYRISSEFIYRNNDVIFVGNSGEIPMTEKALIEGDRSIRYILLQGEQANYAGMAASYREYLIDEGSLKTAQGEDAKMQLRIFGGVVRDEIIGSTFVDMTTFEEARLVIDEFLSKGNSSFEVTYEGWSNDGVLGNQPDHFPAASELGGNKELTKLAAYLKTKNIPLYLEANYVKPFSDSDAVKASRDAIRGMNKEVMKVYKPYVTTRQHSRELYYLLKPDLVFNSFIRKEANAYAKLGVAGVHLKYMGELIYSDHDDFPAFRRSQTIETWQNSLDLMKEKTGHASVDYGMAYTFGHIDRIEGVPLDTSHFTYMDEAIPFYQMVVHGYIPYTSKPANLVDDARVYSLQLLEFGALPSFEVTYKPSSELKRTLIDDLFNTSYDHVLNTDAAAINEIADQLIQLADQKMINHEILQPKVNRTTYENGTQIIVNYNVKDVVIDGQTISGFGYSISKGGGGQ